MNSINQTTGTVKFRLKEVNSKKETSILLDYNFGRGNRIKFATGFKVEPRYWNNAKQKVKAVSTISNREEINKSLLNYEAEFISAISKLDELERQNKNILKSLLSKIIRKVEKKEQKLLTTFFEYADDYIEKREYQSKHLSSVKLSAITVRSYKQTVSRLKDFNKQVKYDLDFENIDLNFYYAFIGYLEKYNYSTNTIGKHIKNLRTILNRATEDGVNKNLSFKKKEFKTVNEETVSIYLTENEIDALYNVDLSKTPDWELARDIFIIGYYIGQRVSDYNGIKMSQIKVFNSREVLEIIQKKTGAKVYVPLHKRVRQIMNNRYNGAFPPRLPDSDINEYIKEAGSKAKILTPITVTRTKGGKTKTIEVEKNKLIVSHSARRSFCTNAYLSKMPVIDIMAISGHSTEREFYKYIKVTPQERAVKIADSAFFKN
ncbi:phage integrase family protein [Lacinutrix venerupis]|uniref:tyrosine-type recombinase/integrase n=1 Tax=Lacinutrix venerupis TaxID=1486034 RepID=UPI000EAC87FF|nr:site-specific integrase [Lacinutrix venerupis]RLJ61596.1 phage integrase family protein [Lacinutrix venerupis]